MIKNMAVKMNGCLNGMLVAERALGEKMTASTGAFELARLLASSPTAEALAATMPPASWMPSSTAAVIGLLFHDRFGDALDFCRTETLFSSPASQCSALAASILVSSACFDVPMGIWPNEVGTMLKGLDNDFVAMIDEAVVSATGVVPESEYFTHVNKIADPDTAIVVMTMFACLRGRSFKISTDIAKAAGPHVTCLTGAVMGTAFPDVVDEGDKDVKEIIDLLIARRNL